MAWVNLGVAAVGVGTSIYGANQANKAANKALDAQKSLAANLKYEPIDIAKLRTEAQQAAVDNATQSLALERQLTPAVADYRASVDQTKLDLAKQVGADLQLGGNLSPDVQNRVTNAGRVIGAKSGIGSGGTVPLTASLLGLSSIDLLNQRRAAASNLAAPGPSPVAGLDPGQIASIEVANNAANNQFNAEKAGVNSTLANSEAAARTAQIGGQTGQISALTNLLGQGIGAIGNAMNRSGVGAPTTYDAFMNLRKPVYTPVDTTF